MSNEIRLLFRPFLEFFTAKPRKLLEHRLKHVQYLNSSLLLISILQGLEKLLLEKAISTLVFEMNIKRVKGLLHGDSSEERFHSYESQLRDPVILTNTFSKYPLLKSLLLESTARYVANTSTIIERLDTVWRQ